MEPEFVHVISPMQCRLIFRTNISMCVSWKYTTAATPSVGVLCTAAMRLRFLIGNQLLVSATALKNLHKHKIVQLEGKCHSIRRSPSQHVFLNAIQSFCHESSHEMSRLVGEHLQVRVQSRTSAPCLQSSLATWMSAARACKEWPLPAQEEDASHL